MMTRLQQPTNAFNEEERNYGARNGTKYQRVDSLLKEIRLFNSKQIKKISVPGYDSGLKRS